jgi:hypothetical protein
LLGVGTAISAGQGPHGALAPQAQLALLAQMGTGRDVTKPPADLDEVLWKALVPALMSQWRQKNPERDWIQAELDKHTIVPPADNRRLIGRGRGRPTARSPRTT